MTETSENDRKKPGPGDKPPSSSRTASNSNVIPLRPRPAPPKAVDDPPIPPSAA